MYISTLQNVQYILLASGKWPNPVEVTHNEDDILHLFQDLSKSFAISGQKWPDSVLL